jgi:heat shock protein HslJ
MKIRNLFIAGAIATLYLASCCAPKSKTADNSQDTPKWTGVYAGVLPCASCPGIQTTITLNNDSTYCMETVYMEEDNEPIVKEGSFTMNNEGNIVTLSGFAEGEGSNKYMVGENNLIQLTLEGNRVEGELADKYVLTKASPLAEKYWKLVTINGIEVKNSEEGNEAHITFKAVGDKFFGSTGCNRFFGGYILNDQGQIIFSGAGSTRMMCADMTVEDNFLKLLDGVINYEIENDNLTLKDSQGIVVATFISVAK